MTDCMARQALSESVMAYCSRPTGHEGHHRVGRYEWDDHALLIGPDTHEPEHPADVRVAQMAQGMEQVMSGRHTLTGNPPGLPDVLRVRRAYLRWSQDELAHAARLSQSSIARYEAGVTEPPLSRAVALAAAVGLTLDELAGRWSSDIRRQPCGCVWCCQAIDPPKRGEGHRGCRQ